MNRERAKELLPIIQAFADGKDVEYNYSGEWKDAKNPAFVCDTQYRVKPEPIVRYTAEVSRLNGEPYILEGVYETEDSILCGISDAIKILRIIKLVEEQ